MYISKRGFLIFLYLTRLFKEKNSPKFETPVPTLFIIIFYSNNNLVWFMMSSIFYLFSFQYLDKLDMEDLYF